MNEKEIYDGLIFRLIQRDVEINGIKTKRDIILHPGGVGVILLKDDKILLVSQYRHAIEKETLEIPAGKLEYGEDPMECGLRELNEETGYTCKKMEPIFSFVSTPGFCNERIWIYKAIEPELAQVKFDQDPDEDIHQIWIDIDKAYRLVQDGTIDDAKTVIAIQHVILERK